MCNLSSHGALTMCMKNNVRLLRANSVKYDCDDWLARLVTSIQERILARNSWKKNWLKNYLRTLCRNWWHWKWTDWRPARTCTSERWPLKEPIIPTSEGTMRWSMMEKQDGISSWRLLTLKYTLCTTVQWQQYSLNCPHHRASYGGQAFW